MGNHLLAHTHRDKNRLNNSKYNNNKKLKQDST